MKPIGPLMREHRTIEKIIPLLEKEMQRIADTGRINSFYILTATDFFRTYTDRTHHGKEEDILFKALKTKKLTPELQKIMDELIQEHAFARKTVAGLNSSVTAYAKGESGAINDTIEGLKELVALYPKHIEKEDKHFFYPILDYFDKQEQDDMLDAFWEFDRSMIHEKYAKVITDMAEERI
jgi:hemerythrin-like domain-containing protein